MEFLQTKNNLWKRWVSNYSTRTQICINLYSNLISRKNNRINVEIANTSREIAIAALRDSSSMITIAAMTMLFFSGIFISAFLGMALHNNIDASAQPTMTVLPQWWIFAVTTVPLTLLVFGIWRIWQRNRVSQTSRVDAGKSEASDKDNQVSHGDGIARRMNNPQTRTPVTWKIEAEATVAGLSEDAP